MGDGNTKPLTSGTAAFVIANNPPTPIQWLTERHVEGFLEAYEYSYVFDDVYSVFLSPEEEVAEEENRRNNFLSRLFGMLERGKIVDIFILSHSNGYYYLLRHIPENLRRGIRLVYNSGCEDAADAKEYLALGAAAYVGHPGISCSPTFFRAFQRYWWRGMPLQEAVSRANEDARSKIVNGDNHDLTDLALDGYCHSIHPYSTDQEKFDSTRARLFGDGSISITSGASRPRNVVEVTSPAHQR